MSIAKWGRGNIASPYLFVDGSVAIPMTRDVTGVILKGIRRGYEIFEDSLQRELYGLGSSVVLYLISTQLVSYKPPLQEMLP